jgi:hypothetical protein
VVAACLLKGARQVLGMHTFANGDLAPCSALGWRPAQAGVQVQQFAYMWRLMHEAPVRTRALHRELAAAPPLTAGYAVDRATGPAARRRGWYSLVRHTRCGRTWRRCWGSALWNGAVAR